MVKTNLICTAVAIMFIVLGSCHISYARTSLAALPQRAETVVTLKPGQMTLIQEKRVLPLHEGVNQIRFSWQNVMILPESIHLQPVSTPNDVRVLRQRFPSRESELIWDIHSSRSIDAAVMITYLLADIDGLSSYTITTGPKAGQIDLKRFLVLRNFSGEHFNDARFILNKDQSIRTSLHSGETKRLLVLEQRQIPMNIHRIWHSITPEIRPQLSTQGAGIPVLYAFNNTRASNLGQHPIEKGKTRIFQTDHNIKRVFLGEDILAYTPVGDTAKLKVGENRDIAVKRRIIEDKKNNVRKNRKGRVQVFDKAITINFIAENLKDAPAVLTIIETIKGDWEPVSFPMQFNRLDHETIEFKLALSAGQKKELTIKYRLKNIFSGIFARFNTLPQ